MRKCTKCGKEMPNPMDNQHYCLDCRIDSINTASGLSRLQQDLRVRLNRDLNSIKLLQERIAENQMLIDELNKRYRTKRKLIPKGESK